MSLVLLLLATLAGVALAFCCAAMSPGTRLVIASALAVPQFYFGPLASYSLPAQQIWLIFMAVILLLKPMSRGPRTAIGWALLMYLVLSALAILWSPDKLHAVLLAARFASFVVAVIYAEAVFRSDPRSFQRSMQVLILPSAMLALLVAVCRVSPVLESSFLHSRAAIVLMGPDAITGLFTVDPNNVLDPAKAGGIFVNANVASLFLGVCATAAAVIALRQPPGKRYLWLSIAAVDWAAVYFTGSKAGAALAITMPLLALLLYRAAALPAAVSLPSAVALAAAALWAVPAALAKVAPTYLEESASSYSDRSLLWHAATVIIGQSPIVGNGYGGWELLIPSVTPGLALPPHNILIAAWSSYGALAPILVMVFFMGLAIQALKLLRATDDGHARLVVALAFSAWCWIFAHGMGDNTALYGESHSLVLAALLLALITGPSRSSFAPLADAIRSPSTLIARRATGGERAHA